MERLLLTRAEIEERLERGLVGKVVSFETIHSTIVAGKLHRLAVEVMKDELLVSFVIDRKRYEADLQYLVENLTINYGDTPGTDRRDVRGILKGH